MKKSVKLKLLSLVPIFLLASNTKADWVCKAKGKSGDIKVVIQNPESQTGKTSAEILVKDSEGKLSFKNKFSDIVSEWDGHKTGLMTAAGFSLSYQSHFGCIRKVSLTTYTRKNPGLIETLSLDSCDNGTTNCD